MSKVFYDELVVLDHIEKEVNSVAKSKEEKEELWSIIDEYVHHKVIGKILHKLPSEHHEEFLKNFIDEPHSANHFKYLAEKIKEDVEEFLRLELYQIGEELLSSIRGKKLTSK